MSGFGGGFGGFGQNNQQQQSTGFGGFGTNNNNTSGFGSNNNTGFGSSTNTGGGLFGNNNNNNTSTGFGGFGTSNNNNTTFGAKPFGATTTSGGLFGNAATTQSTGFGGFGSTANNNTTSGFGSSNTGGGLFGQNKPAFGASTTTPNTGGGLFGNNNASSGFGSNAGTGFGSTTTGGFGAGQAATNNGTASTPFNAFIEKDGASATQHFQTITFQQPYQNFSLEELRMVDYAQGRRYGNQNGQAGAFGQSTGFGGFGQNNNTSTGGFGANTSTTTGGLFGQNNTSTNTGFGANTTNTGFGANNTTGGGGLFGQNKPAGGGLFGSTPATSQSGGGLFGQSNTNTSFGANNTNTSFGAGNTGGGLFGQQNQTQNKPAFGGFGQTNTNTSTGGGLFGQNNANTSTGGGGLFGQTNTSTAPAFGGTNQQTTAGGGGLFGSSFGQNQQNQNQNQNQNQGGGLFGGFGQQNQQQQAKPSLFGSTGGTNQGTSLFGQQPNQTPQTGGGLFGNTSTQQNQGGSLFGQKPVATGGGLFGNSTTNNNAGSGLFGNLGNQNQQQPQATSLFGQQPQAPQKSLFGSTTASNTGGGLFGNLNQNATNTNAGTSLFGSQQQQQNQQPQNNSLFGASGNSLFQTSLQTNPFGNDALFAGITTPNASPGPLATPLSSSQKTRKSVLIPQHKLNPNASSRLLTPQRKNGGYGFSYSTYGTPGSASSNSSPGFSSSLLNSGGFGRSLSKSLSTSNLRHSFTPDTSILAPGAFSSNGRGYASGSLKKLNINRSINGRQPLFGTEGKQPSPSAARKSVSFDTSAQGSRETNGITSGRVPNGTSSGALVRTESSDDTRSNEGGPGSSSTTMNGSAANGAASRPEMEQVNGNELVPVPEDGSPLSVVAPSALNAKDKSRLQQEDPVAGEYWSKPSIDELMKMNRTQLKSVSNFLVGRHNIGHIEFNMRQPVDLTEVPLEKIEGDIVSLTHRLAKVYSEGCTVTKPPLGKGLNVPSRIILEHSWPRARGGKYPVFEMRGSRYEKHIERLKRVGGAHFESYDGPTGVWRFTVDHFSSYGLRDEDFDDEDEESMMDTTMLSDPVDTPTNLRTPALKSSQATGTPQDDDSFVSPSSPDDTFDFKKGKRKRASVPGGYGDDSVYEEDDDDMDDSIDNSQSFLAERSVGSPDGDHVDDVSSEGGDSEPVDDQDMADSVSGPVRTMEQAPAKDSNANTFNESVKPKSILKASQPIRSVLATPSKHPLIFEDDWADQLQRTISPKKQDRQALRQSQGEALKERDTNVPKLAQSVNKPAFANSIDLMNSLFGKADNQGQAQAKRAGKAIELPYAKKPKTSDEFEEMTEADKNFHWCNKPRWGTCGTLAYSTTDTTPALEGSSLLVKALEPIVSEHKDIRFAKFPLYEGVPATMAEQKKLTKVLSQEDVPYANVDYEFDFKSLAKAVNIDTPAGVHEQHTWQLLGILFDEDDDASGNFSEEETEAYIQRTERVRKDRLTQFWESLVFSDAEKHAHRAESAEEKAIAYLSGHNIIEACNAVVGNMDLRLATMIAQINGGREMRDDIRTQIEEWRHQNMLSEMDDSVRALYELIGGNCAVSEGKIGGGLENRASTFKITSRFGMDWRRAFGLRLWYGSLTDEPLHVAIAQYADDLREGREDVRPFPWFIEQDENMGWADPEPHTREDILWGILKIYAASKLELPANVEDVLAPQNTSGNPLNARLSFQVYQLMQARNHEDETIESRRIDLPTDRTTDNPLRSSFLSLASSNPDRDNQTQSPLTTLSDKLTLTYASTLHTPDHWQDALYVYLHLSSPALRAHYIRMLLCTFAHTFSSDDTDSVFHKLTFDLRIPSSWIHQAFALQAQMQGDDGKQVEQLLKAGDWQAAHDVLCRSVAPKAIISRDIDYLREILGYFDDTPVNSPAEEDGPSTSRRGRGRSRAPTRKDSINGWGNGGQIYFDYIALLDFLQGRVGLRDRELSKEVQAILDRLQNGLQDLMQNDFDKRSQEERVALGEIAGTVAREVAENNYSDKSRVLRLPLTEDKWLRHSRELSMSYYRAVLAAAR